MPAVAPLPPDAIRELLESHGYEVIDQDDYNWVFAKGDSDEPVVVPKTVDLVPLEIALHIASKVGFNDYFDKLRIQPGSATGAGTSVLH